MILIERLSFFFKQEKNRGFNLYIPKEKSVVKKRKKRKRERSKVLITFSTMCAAGNYHYNKKTPFELSLIYENDHYLQSIFWTLFLSFFF